MASWLKRIRLKMLGLLETDARALLLEWGRIKAADRAGSEYVCEPGRVTLVRRAMQPTCQAVQKILGID